MVLGIHFSWRFTKSDVVIHMNQSGCSTNLIKQFARDSWESSPTAIPSRSCVPINSIAPSTDDDTSPVQLRCTEAYQSFIWLATNTRPNLAPVHSFLSSYSGKPSSGLMRAALYALHYIHFTHDHGITFSSEATACIHTYVHFPESADVES